MNASWSQDTRSPSKQEQTAETPMPPRDSPIEVVAQRQHASTFLSAEPQPAVSNTDIHTASTHQQRWISDVPAEPELHADPRLSEGVLASYAHLSATHPNPNFVQGTFRAETSPYHMPQQLPSVSYTAQGAQDHTFLLDDLRSKSTSSELPLADASLTVEQRRKISRLDLVPQVPERLAAGAANANSFNQAPSLRKSDDVESDDWVPDTRIGRQRVMTQCPNCKHNNHIRRKICQNCQTPKPPPAKRKRRRKRKAPTSANMNTSLGLSQPFPVFRTNPPPPNTSLGALHPSLPLDGTYLSQIPRVGPEAFSQIPAQTQPNRSFPDAFESHQEAAPPTEGVNVESAISPHDQLLQLQHQDPLVRGNFERASFSRRYTNDIP